MSRTRRWYEIAAAAPVVAVFVTFYAWEIATGPPRDFPSHYLGLALGLAIPAMLWLAASWLLVRHWWRGAGERLSRLDSPGRLLAAAVGTLPEDRRAWGAAMAAELAEVQGRSARWRFALSCAGAALRLPRSGGWPVVAVVAGLVVAAVTTIGPLVADAVPGLGLFAASLVGFVGAGVILTIARSRRLRMPVTGPTALVTVGVVLSIGVTAVFLLRYPESLPPNGAVTLAAGLAGCLWIAVTAGGTGHRLGPHLAAGAALAYVLGGALLNGVNSDEAESLALTWFVFGPPIMLFFAALLAGANGKSFRAGIQAGVWAAITLAPLAYAVALVRGMRQYAIDGTLFDGAISANAGEVLSEALWANWVIVPVIAWPFAVLGAGLGARIAGPPVTQDQPGAATTTP